MNLSIVMIPELGIRDNCLLEDKLFGCGSWGSFDFDHLTEVAGPNLYLISCDIFPLLLHSNIIEQIRRWGRDEHECEK